LQVKERVTSHIQKPFQNAATWLYQSRRRLAIGGVGLLACFIGYHAVFGANGFLVYEQKRTESRKLRQDIIVLQQENSQRQDHIKALTSDPQAIEREARERLRYARKGEVVYTLPPARQTPADKK
jgi:cell division protein FtsB